MDFTDIDRLYEEGLSQGRQGVVGCLVLKSGQVFAQRRSPDRKLFPDCWDLVGGHIEPGETPLVALERELFEETGWILDEVLGLRRVVDWETPGPDGHPKKRREFVLAVSVVGNRQHPQLEVGKVTEGRWFGKDDVEILNENRPDTDHYVYDLVLEELSRCLPSS